MNALSLRVTRTTPTWEGARHLPRGGRRRAAAAGTSLHGVRRQTSGLPLSEWPRLQAPKGEVVLGGGGPLIRTRLSARLAQPSIREHPHLLLQSG
eukprot:5002396-Prymnesium_polylepis.1